MRFPHRTICSGQRQWKDIVDASEFKTVLDIALRADPQLRGLVSDLNSGRPLTAYLLRQHGWAHLPTDLNDVIEAAGAPPRAEPSSNKFSSCDSAQEQVANRLTDFVSLSVSTTKETLLELLAARLTETENSCAL